MVAEQKFMIARKNSPQYVTDLEAVYGGPTQSLLGSAVFYEVLKPEDDLSHVALKKYKYVVGKHWSKAYRDAWKMVYGRSMDASRAIISELRSLNDFQAELSASLILDNIDEAEAGQRALVAAFDDPKIIELTIHKMGDGEAISGLVIAGRRANGEATFLVSISD
ncbi:MAG: hypothetical protein BJG00_005495 [Limnothrix sp. CACIAM 69d]|nr:MAG: hypothetical protein BJG00_005495 [Limnothrix sp. CACIAM 69d]